MDVDTFVKLINSVGFPIVVSGALFWFNVTIIRDMKHALNENTRVIEKLYERLGEK